MSKRKSARNFKKCRESIIETLDFAELKSKLELRFGESQLAQNYYSQFTNRKKFDKNLATLGADIERLLQLVYSECAHPIQDKIVPNLLRLVA